MSNNIKGLLSFLNKAEGKYGPYFFNKIGTKEVDAIINTLDRALADSDSDEISLIVSSNVNKAGNKYLTLKAVPAAGKTGNKRPARASKGVSLDGVL